MVHLIDSPTAQAPGKFVAGNPLASPPVLATQLSPAWCNMLQEELANVVLAAGLPFDKANNGQLLLAITALLQALLDSATARVRTVHAPYDLQAGDPVLAFDVFGFAMGAAVTGGILDVAVLGAGLSPKDPAESFSTGQRLYWDDVSRRVTAIAASGVRLVGTCAFAAGPGVGQVLVHLGAATEPLV